MKRNWLCVATIVFCVILAGASEDESADAKRDRISRENGITTEQYDAALREFGTFEAYQEAKKLNLTPEEYRERQKQEEGCHQDWRRCADNSQLVNNYSKIGDAKFSCQQAANKQAKYGDPKWGWVPFGTFYKGKNYVETGRVILIDDNAQFSNGFGAMVHSEVVCEYNLATQQVVDVSISAQ